MKINKDYILQTDGKENVIARVSDNEILFSLNEVGTYIFKKIYLEDASIDLIINSLCEEYEISEKMATEDVNAFVEELKENNIIVE